MNLIPTWSPPDDWLVIRTIEMHTGGEPLRILTTGLPPVEGRDVLSKLRHFRSNHDDWRRMIVWEPRGHADMYAAVMFPSETADFDVIFLHNEGYSTMCGHAIIALTKLVAESRPAKRRHDPITFNVPCGRIVAAPTEENGKIEGATFLNVPSFVVQKDEIIDVAGVGPVKYDVGFGGAFYAVVDADQLGLSIEVEHIDTLRDVGRRIKAGVSNRKAVVHPYEDDLSFLYGTIFTSQPKISGRHSRNICIFADGEVDRSPTGSGVSARAALHYDRGELKLGQSIEIESILDTTMHVSVVEEVEFGGYRAIVPKVGGTAHFTGASMFCRDPLDPLGAGFLLR